MIQKGYTKGFMRVQNPFEGFIILLSFFTVYVPSVHTYSPTPTSSYAPSVHTFLPTPTLSYVPSVYTYSPTPTSSYVPSVHTFLPTPTSSYVPSVYTYSPTPTLDKCVVGKIWFGCFFELGDTINQSDDYCSQDSSL